MIQLASCTNFMRECQHSRAAPDEAIDAYRSGIRLALGLKAKNIDFLPACRVCGDVGVVCCLSCDHIACRQPKHGNHQFKGGDKHHLGVDISADGRLHCFSCGHAVYSSRFLSAGEQEEAELCMGKKCSQGLQNVIIGSTYPQAGPDTRNPTWHASTGLRGFVNMGATCYVSVIMQSLLHNPLVQSFFLAGGHDRTLCPQRDKLPGSNDASGDCVQCCLDQVISDIFAQASVSGYGLQDLLLATAAGTSSLTGAAEQDAHEYFHFILGELHRTHFASPVIQKLGLLAGEQISGPAHKLEDCTCVSHRGFAAMLQSTLSCSDCGMETVTLDPAMDFSLEVAPGGLDKCLSRFTSPESLANYRCSNCQAVDRCTKQILIQQLPPIVHIQLKRFKHSGLSAAPTKLEQGVEFGFQLDMSPYCASKEKIRKGHAVYDLFAVVLHAGTLDTGHYTCMVKHAQTGLWFHFDDQVITQVSAKQVLDPRAYLLFYAARWSV